MAMSAIPNAPHELVAIALHRARMCEMLAGSALPEERETLFTIGLFSVADALMDMPMERGARVAAVLRRDPRRAAASRRPEGRPARRRARVRARRVPERPGGRPDVSLAGAYRAALEWADEANRAVNG